MAVRPAYTLLEVMVAMSIAVLLMGGLYVAVDVQLRQVQTGRSVVDQSSLARALLNRMASDIAPNIRPVEPNRSASAGTSGTGGAAAPTAGTTPTTPTTNATGTGGTGASGSAPPATTTTTPTTSTLGLNGAVTFNLGVQGDASTLTLYVSRVPREMSYVAGGLNTDLPGTAPVVSDLRRITYWLGPHGLARHEVKVATGEEITDADILPPDVADDPARVVAEEVRDLRFSYWDGSGWLESWDGTAPGADGTTPMGPPMAVAIVVGFAPPGTPPGAEAPLKYYRDVVPIPTANGASQQTTGGDMP